MALQLDFLRFFDSSDPTKTLNISVPTDRPYYINLDAVRGDNIVETFVRKIVHLSPEKPTHQVFTGHIGSGKSTELLRLKSELEQEGLHVVYCEATAFIDTSDVDIIDILLGIIYQVITSLGEIDINVQSSYLTRLTVDIKEFLQVPIELADSIDLSSKIIQLINVAKFSPNVRSQLRQYIEPRIYSILQEFNRKILEDASHKLKQIGKKGIVVIIDNLDRIDNRCLPSGRSQVEYIFIDRGRQLRQLNCHTVYTIPISLIYSDEYKSFKSLWTEGLDVKVLTLVPVRMRDGSICQDGINLLRQVVLVRAFPDIAPENRLDLIKEIFDSPETLDRLCQLSGGHIRHLLGILSRCLEREDPPFLRESLERVIQEYRDMITLTISEHEWDLLRQIMKKPKVMAKKEYLNLLASLLLYEYQDLHGRWCSVDPIVAEIETAVSDFNSRHPSHQEIIPIQKEIMNPEVFLEQTEVTSLILALNQWAIQVNVASDRQQFLENAGIDTAFLSNLRLDTKSNIFAQALVAAFKTYRVSNHRLDYHPMVRFLKHLCELAPIYQLVDKDVALFTRLVERGEENLKALTARSTVGRIESPKGTGIGTGVLISKNLLLTCDHIFSKSRAQQAWVRFNYTANSYALDSDVFELDLNCATRFSREDYALIPVKGEPKQQTAIAIDAILDSGQEIRLIHHPQGQHVVVSELGQVVQVGEDYIDHNISTDKGSSGAPIFNRDWQLVAIHRGHPGTGAGRILAPGTTSGLPLRAFWTQIQSHLS